MTSESLSGIYQHRLDDIRNAIRDRSRWIGYISLFRLVSLAAAIYFLVRGIRTDYLLWFGGCLLMVMLFLILVARHNRQKERRKILRELEWLNETELACLEHRYDKLPDGSHYSDRSHPWSYDLDIFGQGSLYQFLNRTATLKGNQELARILTTEPENPEEVILRQEIIRDLSEKIGFRQDFTARARLIRENKDDLEDLSGWLSADAYISKQRWLFPLALGVSGIALAIIVSGIIEPSNFRLLLPLLFFNWAMLSPFFARTNRYQSAISRKHELLEGYAALLQIISATQFGHPDLKRQQADAEEAQQEVLHLSKLLNVFDQRLNMLLGVILNSLFLFDFIMLRLLERWKQKNREHVLQWIEMTGWMDARISLAGFAFNHPGYAYPRLDDGRNGMEMEQLGHPLIPDIRRVDNDLTIRGEKVVIITGANMAGKSTFLRSLGVNTVLAYTGCPVCAGKFHTGFSGLHTSMRTADSLRDEESYFLAEIKRLEQIVRRMERKDPLLILLDEVLKGTNTTDKRQGSVGLIDKAVRYPVRCFIATHDLSLGGLEVEHPGRVVNYCFESIIREKELEFDYTIRKGVATNMNASFLMKQMRIMD